MKTLILFTSVTVAMLLTSESSHAGRVPVYVGTQDSLHRLSPVPLKGSNGEELDLSYKTSKLFLGLGIYCKDDGYVLSKRDDLHSYIPFPDEQQLERFQAAGLLPKPLPSYKVSLWDYAVGYSLWWIGLTVVVFFKLKEGLAHKRHAPAPNAVLAR